MKSPGPTYTKTPDFERDIKKLEKKQVRTLREDIENLKRYAITPYYKGERPDEPGLPIQGQGVHDEYVRSYKIKKMASRSLKGGGSRSGLRLIYQYIEEDDEVLLIEVYYKGNKENEDRERLRDAFNSHKRLDDK